MSSKETGKTRVQRIQLDYYKRKGGLSHLRRVVILVVLVASGCYAIYAGSSWGSRHISTGPLSTAHVSFESDCQACHVSGLNASISSDSWRFHPEQSLAHLEEACQKCHAVESHFRNHLQDANIDRNCSGCHREHEGREHQLTLIADNACLQCHAELDQQLKSDEGPHVESNINDFASHPPFRSLSADAGQIKFDHFQHLQAGLVIPGSRGGIRVENLSDTWREIYRKEGQPDASLVQLECRDCHRRSSFEDMAPVTAADRELGRYFEPIQFDQHCASCHDLNYYGRPPEQLPLPHAAPWSEIRSLLTAKLKSGHAGEIRMPSDPKKELMPGESALREATAVPPDIEFVMAGVRDRCLLCHDNAHITAEYVLQARSGDVRQPLIPARWFKYGIFDHTAHARMNCQYCHNGVYQERAGAPQDHQHVMIGDIETCIGCHRGPSDPFPERFDPEDPLLGGEPNWASDRCTLCHRYHWTRPSDDR